MAATAQDVIDVLRSIDASLKALVAAAPKPPPVVADAADLDGQYGDPEIRQSDPKEWRGDSQMGKRFSQCPPEYLDLVASRLEYFADKADREGKTTSSGKPVGPFNRRDAARARGWAARMRAGWKPPAADDSSMFGEAGAQPLVPGLGGVFSDDQIPF